MIFKRNYSKVYAGITRLPPFFFFCHMLVIFWKRGTDLGVTHFKNNCHGFLPPSVPLRKRSHYMVTQGFLATVSNINVILVSDFFFK